MVTTAEYEAQVQRMADAGRRELQLRPTAQIEFTMPKGVVLVADLRGALALGVLRVNPDGLKVLEAMSASCGDGRRPTVLMLQVALQIACGVNL